MKLRSLEREREEADFEMMVIKKLVRLEMSEEEKLVRRIKR